MCLRTGGCKTQRVHRADTQDIVSFWALIQECELLCTCSCKQLTLYKQLSITQLAAPQAFVSTADSDLWPLNPPAGAWMKFHSCQSNPLGLSLTRCLNEPHLGPSGCVTFREVGFRMSLSSAATTSQNLGRLLRSFCQQSSMSACREAGHSGGGGSR